MRTLLEALYLGELAPHQQTTYYSSRQTAREQDLMDCRRQLRQLLGPEHLDLMLRLEEAQRKTAELDCMDQFILGFRMGIQLITEGLTDD